MKPGSDKLRAKAERALAAAEAALNDGAPDAAAARAFYAILYAAKLALNERGIRLRGHARIAAASAPPLRDWLSDAIARRRDAESDLTYEHAEHLIERARASLARARSAD